MMLVRLCAAKYTGMGSDLMTLTRNRHPPECIADQGQI